MPFIGNQPALSYTSFAKQDFTTSATTSYTLDHPVTNENEIALFINFVRQEPGTAYTASNTNLNLTSATSASDDMYCVYLGKAVQTVNPPAGSVGASQLADNAVTSAKLASGAIPNQSAFKNIIINGDMSIAQRGTSSSSVTSSAYLTVDRWFHNVTTMGTWTLSQSTDVPSGQGFAKSVKWDCTTADASPSGTDRIMFQQYIEGQNLQYLKKGTSNAESLTLSFWVKSSKTGTYICELRDMDNSRHISKSYTISAANTWEKKTITYDGDTTGAFDNDNATSLRLNFWLGTSSTYSSGTLATSWSSYVDANRAVGQVNLADSTSNEWYITGVQLEAGTSASDFEFLPFDVNLERCLRYYQKSFEYDVTPVAGVTKSEYQHIGNFTTNEFAGLMSHYKKEMRTTPTVTIYTTSTSSNGTGRISWYNGSSWSNATASIQGGSNSKNFNITGSSFPNIVLAQYNYEAEAEL